MERPVRRPLSHDRPRANLKSRSTFSAWFIALSIAGSRTTHDKLESPGTQVYAVSPFEERGSVSSRENRVEFALTLDFRNRKVSENDVDFSREIYKDEKVAPYISLIRGE